MRSKSLYSWPFGLLVSGLIVVPVASMAFQQAMPQGSQQTPPAGSEKGVVTVNGQPVQAGGRALSPQQQAMQAATNADHQDMMNQLHIATADLRRGRDGNNKDSPYYANYDEAKANPYPNLPDPLTLKNGKKVTKAADWVKKRRPEIVEDFDREVYGRVPKDVPAVKWEVIKTSEGKVGDVDVITRQVQGTVDNTSYPQIEVKIALTVAVPKNAKGPVPMIMQFGGFGFGPPPGFGGRGAGAASAGRGGVPGGRAAAAGQAPARGVVPGFGGRGPVGPSWQQQVLAKGWGYATLAPNSIQADNGAGLTAGIIGLCNKGQHRKPDDWGALRAWAWGASRAIDYFETDKAVDAKHVAIEGHSRYGKAALVAMAYEPRMWTAYVSSSGEGGAKLHRRNWGEIVENVTGTGEYHWMAGNFIKYGANPLHWNDLPVDSHELIALCAPRPVFISGGATNGDGWVDAKGMFMAAAAAGPVYRLLGKKDLGTTTFPPIETALVDGDVAFRQHSSGHTDGPNWPFFLDFAEKHLNGAGVIKTAKK